MITRHRRFLRPLSLAVLVLFTLSLLWCAEDGCGSDGQPDDCSSIVCALLHGHDDQTGPTAGASSKSCSCPAQAPSLASAPTVPNTLMLCEGALPVLAMRGLTTPNPSIFRPPLV